ncbi:lipocalin family protein [uncultured Christiangramia sp.]|uniref:lipocalin family protein n=1 Tax=uncultured Christiangramia sp. TaxID=503836 RepID=UPI0025F549C8|nr:lipocalin family protein [uncultured Christiangramia sp.]
MKKILILLLFTGILASCSDDDDAGVDNDGSQIIGTWYLQSVRPIGGSNLLDTCNQDSFIQFNQDGSSVSEFYQSSDSECELESENTGNWTYEGGDNYTFFLPYIDERTTGNVNFISENSFILTTSDLPGFEVVFEK